ncbi:hypothetical protein [Dyadobacter psychrotolerans]|uniref:Uncharacterized protein n=1 Tax=Dyadobacter psychrotolerans TaxID=2541721 RepID=A0A4R5DJ84_9BACT|nr:hypothetical protein [Dyadobacter psychrotolerans]TDE13397.1 hypothetical protein E0F88_20405 [Dyadobacter psychrotolerans]
MTHSSHSKYFILTITLLLTFSCGNNEPSHDELVGTWFEPEQGAKIELLNNEKAIITGLGSDLFEHSGFKITQPIHVDGMWELVKLSGRWRVLLTLNKTAELTRGYGLPLDISNNFGNIILISK